MTTKNNLFTSKQDEIRVLCDDDLSDASFVEICQLCISLVGSHYTVHTLSSASLV